MKAFVRYGSNDKIIAGTLVKSQVTPSGYGWVEVPFTYCCSTDVTVNINPSKLRAFIKYSNGVVVPGSTVVRKVAPKVGVWKEISYTQCCNYVAPTPEPEETEEDPE